MSWEPTTEVTYEQVFAWFKQDFAEQMKQPYALPIKRSYMGLVRMNEERTKAVAYQDADYARGYRVIYWRFNDGRPREVCAVEKLVAP